MTTWHAEGSVQLFIDAPPDRVYDAVADVTATGDRSLECQRCVWLPGAPPGAPGARFRGHNRKGRFIRWSRTCEITEADRGREFAFRTIPTRLDPSRRDSTTWRYQLVPEGTGCRVTHAYAVTKMPPLPFKTIYGRLMPHHRDMRPHMLYTLESLRDQLARVTSHV